MAWIMDTYSMHVGATTTAVVTGKPIEMGGSLGRREATGRGVMITTREAAKHLGLDMKGATVAVQGFGNVGSVSAQLLNRLGAKIVAVTDWKGGVYDPTGLDVDKLIPWVAEHKTVAGFPTARPSTSRSFSNSTSTSSSRRAGKPDHQGQRVEDQSEDRRRRRQRTDDAGSAQAPARAWRLRHSRHPRQRRRRDHFVLRVGAGSSRILLGRGRRQRAARAQDARGLSQRPAHQHALQDRHAHRRLHRRDQSGGLSDEAQGNVRVVELETSNSKL
jgi:hypothetical protein